MGHHAPGKDTHYSQECAAKLTHQQAPEPGFGLLNGESRFRHMVERIQSPHCLPLLLFSIKDSKSDSVAMSELCCLEGT